MHDNKNFMLDFRFGSKADIGACPRDVRFTPKADIGAATRSPRRRWQVAIAGCFRPSALARRIAHNIDELLELFQARHALAEQRRSQVRFLNAKYRVGIF